MAKEETKKGPGGRPLKFKSPEELEQKIQAYFNSCYKEVWEKDKEGEWRPVTDHNGDIVTENIRPLTVSGLAVALDTTRELLINYGDKEEFSNAIKKAKERIQQYAEDSLHTNPRTAGVIFSLINNYGWVQKQEIDHNIDVNIQLDGNVKDWSR